MKYDFLNDLFTTYEPVEYKSETLFNLPLFDEPIEMPQVVRITDEGIPIIKNNRESFIFNQPEVPQTQTGTSQKFEQEIPEEITYHSDGTYSVKSQKFSGRGGTWEPGYNLIDKAELSARQAVYNILNKISKNKVKYKTKWANDLAEAYRKIGVSENGIKNLIAKNAHESNFGQSVQGKFNYGNITAGRNWKGKYVDGRDYDGNGKPITNRFRSYDSLEEFARDEVEFLTRLYDFNENDSFETFVNKLQGGNKGKRYYAGDKRYKENLKSRYDKI